MFQVGKKVICIQSGFILSSGIQDANKYPGLHEVLTVDYIDTIGDDLFLSFEKYNHQTTEYNHNYFISTHFRPLEGWPDKIEHVEIVEERQFEILEPA